MLRTVNLNLNSDEDTYLTKWRELHPTIKLAPLMKELLFNYLKQKEYVVKNRATHFLTFNA